MTTLAVSTRAGSPDAVVGLSPDNQARFPAEANAGEPGRPAGRACSDGSAHSDGGATPLPSRKLRGDPNLAPRCGANTRAGLACRAPAMRNARCRMHGGRSTGPRTTEGLARLAAAHTTHGTYSTASRAIYLHQRTTIVRCRLFVTACELEPYLSADIAGRMALGGKELTPPRRPYLRPVVSGADNTPCNLVPGLGKRVAAARDARGRFVARVRAAARGRRGEREAARAEAAMLAPWRAGLVRARLVKRWAAAMRREAREAGRGQDPMHPMAVASGAGRAGVAEGALPTAESRLDMTGAGSAGGPAIRECAGGDKNPMHLTTVRSGTELVRCEPLSGVGGPAIPECAGGDKNPIHLTAVGDGDGGAAAGAAPPSPVSQVLRDLSRESGRGKADKNPMHLTTVRSGESPFRRRLLASAVCHTATAQKLVAQVERGGGWTVLMALDAAKQAGEDWRPRVAEARQRLIDEAERRRTSCLLRVAAGAAIGRWDGRDGGA